MAITENDRLLMDEVAQYFRKTKTEDEPSGSIRDTAIHFGINRTKIRKILITTGDFSSDITEQALRLKDQGLSNREIAVRMKMSEASISTYLPYDGLIYHSPDASDHAKDVREYRAYEKAQRDRQKKLKDNKGEREMTAKKKEDYSWKEEWAKEVKLSYKETDTRPHRVNWEEAEERFRESAESNPDMKRVFDSINETIKNNNGKFPGALDNRDTEELEAISGEKLPFEPRHVLRLHMELTHDYASDEDIAVLKKYGGVEYGELISRDMIVPYDIPLYALHFAIQRAFGWQNSHLHQFLIPEERYKALTNDCAHMWHYMVGILFRSPLMNEEDEFWADDYNGGSVKNWLRKKYTGPYRSQCYGEGLISCQGDMQRIDMKEKYYLVYAHGYNHETKDYDGEEYLSGVYQTTDAKGNKVDPPKTDWNGRPVRVEKKSFAEIPCDGLLRIFDRYPLALLERLPLWTVLGSGMMHLPDDCDEDELAVLEESLCHTGDEMFDEVKDYVVQVFRKEIDSPDMQVHPRAFTDRITYEYDFGDDWKVEITGSWNCSGLVESGRITQAELDRANIKCRETYRPVLIAKDGDDVMDDVGGVGGYVDFLRTIHPNLKDMDPEEKDEARQEKQEYLEWAKGQGWKRNARISKMNLL